MDNFIELLSGLSTAGIVTLVIVVLVFVVVVVAYIRRLNIGKRHNTLPSSKPDHIAPPGDAEDAPPASKSILGTGQVKCMAIRPGNILDFTTIPKPIGDIYVADTSCARGGASCIVRELDNEEIVDYDPREKKLDVGSTPEYAYFATHWEIVDRVFCVPSPWWRSTSTWFAAGMMAVTFILGLVVLGE